MQFVSNPWRKRGLPDTSELAIGNASTNCKSAVQLYSSCPKAKPTPLLDHQDIAAKIGVAHVFIKDERSRMGLGSFKALGAAYAIAKKAEQKVRSGGAKDHETALKGMTFSCASAGNHGLSLAAGAPLFGAQAVVFISKTVPEAFAQRLKARGAKVIRAGNTYEESMMEAERQSAENEWQLLPDSTWLGEIEAGRDVMEGYLVMGNEVADQLPTPPTHIFLQAGVGGLAAACAISARAAWGDDVTIIIVEPEAAPALLGSIEAGAPVAASGPVSNMGRLDCKEPSHLALKALAHDADYFVTISDDEAGQCVSWLKSINLSSTPSGAAGVAALQSSRDKWQDLGIDKTSRILCYLSEGPEDA